MQKSLSKAMESKEEKPFEEAFTDQEKQKKGTIEYKENAKLNIIWFTHDGIGLAIVHRLIQEGNNVILGIVKDKKDIGDDSKEEPEAKRRRLSQYDGILQKRDAMEVIESMKDIDNKDEWIVFFDFNNMGLLAEKVLELGFIRGLFPVTEDTELERDRNAAKEIIKEYYSDLSLSEVQEFKSIQDAIKMLGETDKIWVLKGNSDNAKTVVPQGDDPEAGRKIITDSLEAHVKDYESEGFILEEKIIDGYELTPQAVFYNGKPIMFDVDIENKNIGAGNVSIQTGAMQTLVIKTTVRDEINNIAFPDWVYEKAKNHPGLFIVDAGIICKDDKYYFTEFCFNRFGFDSMFAEITMSGSATDFFDKLFNGKNPLNADFGVAVRALNMHKDDKERRVLEGISMSGDTEDTWIFECKEEEDKIVSTGVSWDMVVFSGKGETVEKSVDAAYEKLDKFVFEDLYSRPKFDFMSFDYQNSIPNRFSELNHKLFEAKDIKKQSMKKKYDNEVLAMKQRVEEALNSSNEDGE